MSKKYDYLIVGAGLYGSTFAQRMLEEGKKILIIDKRHHIGGNAYTHEISGINTHVYGAHIFHTNMKNIWKYIRRFAEFNHYVNRPKVLYNNKLYSFPINLFTLYQLWGVKTPEEAKAKLASVKAPIKNPKNLEGWILSQVGKEIYEKFIKGYTTKQWNCHPNELPPFIIRRLPIRLNFDDNYFTDPYQGIPIGGYTRMVEKMIYGADIDLSIDFFSDRDTFENIADRIVYTGPIDEFFRYELGKLDYRSLRFETKVLDMPDFQGNAVINYTDEKVPFTRIIEHKHFEFPEFKFTSSEKTVITEEYPDDWDLHKIPYYPINDDKNNMLYEEYKAMTDQYPNVIFGGRLAEYKYYNMDQVIDSALHKTKEELALSNFR